MELMIRTRLYYSNIMKRVCLYILLLTCFACQTNEKSIEQHQRQRDEVIDVKSKVQAISTEEILLGNIGVPYIMDNYLLIEGECAVNEKCIHIYDKNNYRYIKSVINMGPGPEEITRMGHIGIDEKNRCFYLSDFGKLKIFAYDLDSLLTNDNYVGVEKIPLDLNSFPADYEYINDTLCIGRVITPQGTNNYVPRVARWNMKNGQVVPISPMRDDLEKIRITCAASGKYGLYVEMYNRVDLLSIGDFDGNLKAVVYGPEWNSKSHKSYFSKAVFCNDNKLIVSYSGEDYNTSTTKKLMVFDLEGNYLKTLDVGYDILSMCYDDEQNRLIMNFNDDIQIGYLDLDDLF